MGTLRQRHTGTFTAEQLSEMLTRQIAWSTTGNEGEEADFRAMAREGLDAISEDADAVAVEIKNGRIESVVVDGA